MAKSFSMINGYSLFYVVILQYIFDDYILPAIPINGGLADENDSQE